MVRVSFGSRANDDTDYLTGHVRLDQSQPRGPFSSLHELTDALLAGIQTCQTDSGPECCAVELSVHAIADIPLLQPLMGPFSEGGKFDLPEEFKLQTASDDTGPVVSRRRPIPYVPLGALLSPMSRDIRTTVQRAASRGIMQAIEQMDGFKYSFNNVWAAKDEDGLRFSWICQDSMQNKDRKVNGFSKRHAIPRGEERGPRKLSYDCKGSVSVKFSSTRQRVDVFYRHAAIHPTVAERRPPPRARNQEHRRDAQLEQHTGTENGDNHVESPNAQNETEPTRQETSPADRPRKRKRGPAATSNSRIKRPLSLAELLRQSESASKTSMAAEVRNERPSSTVAPPVKYDLPSWQTPPPVRIPPPQQSAPLPPVELNYTPPYQPPYQPSRAPASAENVPPVNSHAQSSLPHPSKNLGISATNDPPARYYARYYDPLSNKPPSPPSPPSTWGARISQPPDSRHRPIIPQPPEPLIPTDAQLSSGPKAGRLPLQGLFQTLKPTKAPKVTQSVSADFLTYDGSQSNAAQSQRVGHVRRASSSLWNTDLHNGYHDMFAPTPFQDATTTNGLGGRESPDPWFPKR